jgi:hypothetical protein
MIGKLMLDDELDGACEEVMWRDLRWWPRILDYGIPLIVSG